MDKEIRQLERLAANGDLLAENALYHKYQRLGRWDDITALLERRILIFNRGRNRDCFSVLSFGGKDADLEPEGCTGIRSLTCSATAIQVEVGGHKIFVPDEESLDDDAYIDALGATLVSGFDLDWTGEEWTCSYKHIISVPYQSELQDTAISIIEEADIALSKYSTDMAEAHEIFHAITPRPGHCAQCNLLTDDLMIFELQWLCPQCYWFATDIIH